jgi:peroxiredoxin
MCELSKHTSAFRTWVICGLLVIVLLGLLTAQACLPIGSQVGNRAPDFTLVDLEGNTVRLNDFRGKVVFLNFWAIGCPPCRAEMPEMEELYQEYKDEDVVIIGVNVGEPESIVRYFVTENGFSWTFVIDTTGSVSREYMVLSIPSSFFIDRDGIIQATNIGYMSKAVMEAKLAEAMK